MILFMPSLAEFKKIFPSVYAAYADCFGKPPYDEYFAPNAVKDMFEGYIRNGILLLAYDETLEECVGFMAAVPLRLDEEVADIAVQYGLNAEDWWFIADFGVVSSHRKRGLAFKLGQALLGYIPAKNILSRTNERNIASIAAHRKLGFSLVADMEQVVESKRIDGSYRKDRRIFMRYLK